MLLGEPVEKVIAHAGDQGMSTLETYAFLQKCGFTWNAMLLPSLIWDGFYIITVPSLNIDARNHAILMEVEGGTVKAYDPNNGKQAKRYYNYGDLNAVEPRSWSEPIYAFRGGKLP